MFLEMEGTGGHTSELSEPRHIPLRHDLSVLESWAQGGDVRVLEGVLEHVQDDRVRPISNSVNVLIKKENGNKVNI